MLMEAKHQLRVVLLSLKFNIMREMTNRFTFIINILFMMLNNATFIIQWVILFHLKTNIGGYNMNGVMILWAMTASIYGLSHILFNGAFNLSNLIIGGKLDAYLVQPKNVLISVITQSISISAIGDLIYGCVVFCIFGFNISKVLLFILFTISGSLLFTSFSIILGSISFWIVKGDVIHDTIINMTITCSTYPDGIFKGVVRLIIYTIVPAGIVYYIPVKSILKFEFTYFLIHIILTIVSIFFAFYIFHKGLKRYSSGNLMSARI
jgi:ABC-2 type transport system permease protein